MVRVKIYYSSQIWIFWITDCSYLLHNQHVLNTSYLIKWYNRRNRAFQFGPKYAIICIWDGVAAATDTVHFDNMLRWQQAFTILRQKINHEEARECRWRNPPIFRQKVSRMKRVPPPTVIEKNRQTNQGTVGQFRLSPRYSTVFYTPKLFRH